MLDLYLTDATNINRVTYEDPLSTSESGIKLDGSTTTNISNVIYWNPNDSDTTLTGSTFIYLNNCRSIKMERLHIERCIMETTIKLNYCSSIQVESIHTRYRSMDTFKLNNVKGLTIDGWNSWENKTLSDTQTQINNNTAGKRDIWVFGSYNQEVILSNYYFTDFTNSTEREPIIQGDLQIERTTKIINVGDSNYTIVNKQSAYQYILPQITANRIISLPTNPSDGDIIVLFNRNTSSYKWSTNVAVIVKSILSITELSNEGVYVISGAKDGTYRLVSHFRDFSTLSDNQTFTGQNIFSQNLLIGSTTDISSSIRIDKNMTGGTEVTGLWNRGVMQSDVSNGYYFRTTAQVSSGSNLNDLIHYRASQGNITGSTQFQDGFIVESNLTGAVQRNVGFRGKLALASNIWNMYLDGTARNHIQGTLLMGTTTDNGTDKLQVNGSIKANYLTISTGTGSPKGSTTLASGVSSSISVTNMTASSNVQLTLESVGGTVSSTWQYKVTKNAGSFTITAITNTGATNTLDTSTIGYYVTI